MVYGVVTMRPSDGRLFRIAAGVGTVFVVTGLGSWKVEPLGWSKDEALMEDIARRMNEGKP